MSRLTVTVSLPLQRTHRQTPDSTPTELQNILPLISMHAVSLCPSNPSESLAQHPEMRFSSQTLMRLGRKTGQHEKICLSGGSPQGMDVGRLYFKNRTLSSEVISRQMGTHFPAPPRASSASPLRSHLRAWLLPPPGPTSRRPCCKSDPQPGSRGQSCVVY